MSRHTRCSPSVHRSHYRTRGYRRARFWRRLDGVPPSPRRG
jgi:hypothetical protein